VQRRVLYDEVVESARELRRGLAAAKEGDVVRQTLTSMME
jgi:hypothetical protein